MDLKYPVLTIFRLLTATLLTVSFCTPVIADPVIAGIVVSPSNPRTNQAFDITVNGMFAEYRFVTNHSASVIASNINIDIYAPSGIALQLQNDWQITEHFSPLAAGEYIVTAVMHGGDIYHEDGYTQTAHIWIEWPSRITGFDIASDQATNETPALNLSFRGNTASTFALQRSIDLNTWTNEIESLHMTNLTHNISFPINDTSRFYRIVEDTTP